MEHVNKIINWQVSLLLNYDISTEKNVTSLHTQFVRPKKGSNSYESTSNVGMGVWKTFTHVYGRKFNHLPKSLILLVYT